MCYMTKMSLAEGTLGIGISLKKSPRTGLVMYVNPTMDTINMRSFNKLKVRRALSNERFTHWLPLYFGESDIITIEEEEYDKDQEKMVKTVKKVNLKERFDTLFENSLRFIMNNSTKKPYTSETALKFMLKLVGTSIIELMKEERHISILAIRRVFNYLRLFAWLMEKDPKIALLMKNDLKTFMSSPENRHKDTCANMLDYQIMAVMVGRDHTEFIAAYTDEQLDRQVLWILKEIPDLDFEAQSKKKKKNVNPIKVDESQRAKVSFMCGKTGFYLTLCFHHINSLLTSLTGNDKDMSKLSTLLDQNHGCLSSSQENKFQ